MFFVLQSQKKLFGKMLVSRFGATYFENNISDIKFLGCTYVPWYRNREKVGTLNDGSRGDVRDTSPPTTSLVLVL